MLGSRTTVIALLALSLPVAAEEPDPDAEVWQIANSGRDAIEDGRIDEGLREIELAIAAAERLGFSATDLAKLYALRARGRSERLHERLAIDLDLSFGWDSNVLQGSTVETIGGVNVRQPTRRSRIAARGEQPNAPEQSEPALPLGLGFAIDGRTFRKGPAELWLGYHFTQILFPFSSARSSIYPAPPTDEPAATQDSYNFQEHRVPAWLRLTPTRWLTLKVKLDGIVSFTGLQRYDNPTQVGFTPYQGGFSAGLDAVAVESTRFRSRLAYAHVYGAMLDRTAGDCNDPAKPYLCFDLQRDTLKLIQELKQAWFRGQIFYQFTAYASGELEVKPHVIRKPTDANGQPLVNPRTGQPLPAAEGEVGVYRAPTSYFGHQAGLQLRFTLPAAITITVDGSYEFRGYRAPTRFYECARPTGTPLEIVQRILDDVRTLGYVTCAGVQSPPREVVRADHRVAAGLSARREFAAGFGVEISYSLLYNFSNIVNALDNRSYSKHGVTLAADWSF